MMTLEVLENRQQPEPTIEDSFANPTVELLINFDMMLSVRPPSLQKAVNTGKLSDFFRWLFKIRWRPIDNGVIKVESGFTPGGKVIFMIKIPPETPINNPTNVIILKNQMLGLAYLWGKKETRMAIRTISPNGTVMQKLELTSIQAGINPDKRLLIAIGDIALSPPPSQPSRPPEEPERKDTAPPPQSRWYEDPASTEMFQRVMTASVTDGVIRALRETIMTEMAEALSGAVQQAAQQQSAQFESSIQHLENTLQAFAQAIELRVDMDSQALETYRNEVITLRTTLQQILEDNRTAMGQMQGRITNQDEHIKEMLEQQRILLDRLFKEMQGRV